MTFAISLLVCVLFLGAMLVLIGVPFPLNVILLAVFSIWMTTKRDQIQHGTVQ